MKKSATKSTGYSVKQNFMLLLSCLLISSLSFASNLDLDVQLTPYDADCGNVNNGAITSVVSGGAPPYTYAWSNGENTPGIVDLAPGTYTLTVTDLAGTQVVTSADVAQEDSDIELQLNASYETCEGSCDGNVSVNASGGAGGFTYQWDDPNNTTFVVVDDACAGIYTVTVTDENGCTAVGSIELELSPEGIWLMMSGEDANCPDLNDGFAHVSIMTGEPPYDIEWSNGATNVEDIFDLTPGVYSVTVTDVNGCSNTDSIEIEGEEDCCDIELQLNASYETCEGSCDGNVSVNASGGAGGFTYQWDDPNNTTFVVVDNACAGIYTVTVTDEDGCTAVGSIELELSPEGIWLMTTGTDATCPDLDDGSAYVGIMTGVPPYDIEWSNGVTDTVEIFDLTPGTYYVTVTDVNGCFNVDSVEVGGDNPIDVVLNYKEDADCNENNGQINMGVIGGDSPYSYSWNTGQTTQDLDNIGPGTYVLTVTDANGCTGVSEEVIINGSSIEITVENVIDATCGLNNGGIDISVSGGTEPYSYEWSPGGATTQDLSNIAPGTYSVTVTDADDCTAIETSIIVGEGSAINITIENVVDATCGLDNGSIDISVSGGTEPYSYEWSPGGATTQDLSNLAAGDYTVTVTDAEGCTTVEGPINVGQSPAIVITVEEIVDATCGLDNGSIDISVSGGNAPYTYEWNPGGATTEDLSNLAAGDYTVTVTDADGCTAVEGPINVDQLGGPQASVVQITNADCGQSNGSIEIQVSGGTEPYSYVWDDATASTTQNLENLSPGTYSVTVTDANNCTVVLGPIEVGEEDCCDEVPVIESVVVVETPCNLNEGIATISMVGNNDDYNYSWSPNIGTPNSTGNSRTGLPAGFYSVTITNANDPTCPSLVEEFTIGVSDFPDVTIVSANPADCGQANGSVEMSEPGFEYLWCNGETGYNPTNLPAGMCVVEITDPSTGCTDFQTIIIDEINNLTADAIVNNYPDCGLANGVVTIQVSNGSGTYNYIWSNGNTTDSDDDLAAGVYSVTVSEAASPECEAVVVFTLIDNVPGGATIDITEPVLTNCVGSADATVVYDIIYDPNFVNPPTVTIVDANGNPQTNGNLSAGSYCIQITDGDGCLAAQNCFEVEEPSQIDVDIAIDDNCPSPSINIVEVIGGTAPYSFAWSNMMMSQNISDLEPGTYSVTVTDANGCSVVADNLNITAQCVDCPDIEVQSVVVVETTCGNSEGIASIEMVGNNGDYTYTWMPDIGTPNMDGNSRSDLPAGAYTVSIALTSEPSCPPIEETFTVGNSDFPLVTLAATTPATCNESNGTAVMSNLDFEYLWLCSGETGNNPTMLPAGPCIVEITDPVTGCTDYQTVVIDTFNPLMAEATINAQPDCGESNGSVTINVAGGSTNYTYEWSNGASTQTVDNLPSGNYCVTVTDNGPTGCVTEVCFVLLDNVPGAEIIINGDVSTSCIGSNDGTVDFEITYDPAFAQPADTTFVCGGEVVENGSLAPGECCIIITDANGCTAAAACFEVGEPTQIDMDIAIHNDCDPTPGIEIVETIGGTMPYTYDWSDLPGNDNPEDRPDLETGSYGVTVTDANGCTAGIDNLMVLDTCACPPMLINSVVVVESNCGESTGQATVNIVNAGSLNLAYEWSTGGTNPTEQNLEAGTYAVTITNLDREECFIVEQLSVGNADGPQTTIESTPALCGSADGTVTFSNPDFEYVWSDVNIGTTGNIVVDLAVGTYFVTVSDPNDTTCIDVVTVVVDEEPSFLISAAINNLPDCGESNGSVTITPAPDGDYSYSWGNNTANNLSSGAYTVTVTDNTSGCTATTSFVLTDNVPNVNLDVEAEAFVSCPGQSDGTIVYTAIPGYTITIQDINGVPQTNGALIPGTYCLVVVDANDCVAGGGCVDVRDPDQIDVDVAVFDEECGEPGEIQLVEVIGGAGGYVYEWDPNTSDSDTIATNLSAGLYSFTVTDANDCQVSETVELFVDDNALELIVSGDTTICGDPVLLTADANGETYVWTNDDNVILGDTSFLMVDTTGTFYVIVTNGDCVDTASITIVPDGLEVIIPDQTACFGTSGILNPDGDSTLVYEWSPSDMLDDPNAVSPTVTSDDDVIFTVTVTDSLGVCSDVVEVNYSIDEVEVMIDSDGPNFCSSDTVMLTANGTPGATLTWFDQNNNETCIGSECEGVPGNPNEPNTYYVVANLNGCIDTDTVTLSNFGLEFEIDGEDLACNGDTIFLQFIGGSTSASALEGAIFEWSGPDDIEVIDNGEGALIEVTTSGTYTLTIENAYCSGTNQYDVTVPELDLEATAMPDEIFLSDNSDLDAETEGLGISYTWTVTETGEFVSNAQSPTVTPDETTRYTVEIIDENGCVETRTVVVTVLQPECEEPYIFFPNAFSPNGDGENDVLYLRGLNVTEVYFAIYNRWGEKVYESFSQDDGWDGTFKGKELSSDVYGFYLRVRCEDGDEFYKQGNVTLFR